MMLINANSLPDTFTQCYCDRLLQACETIRIYKIGANLRKWFHCLIVRCQRESAHGSFWKESAAVGLAQKVRSATTWNHRSLPSYLDYLLATPCIWQE